MDNILKNVQQRTNGELFLGVVGPVRSGKSLFIRNFMKMKVLPYLESSDEKNKLLDELPQSSDGKQIMTVEPKFVPTNLSEISIDEKLKLKIRLVDCVGYIIPNSCGYLNDDGSNKYVHTPWFNEDITFEEASNIGTKKVIENHSNIGVVITSDGSFSDFSREDYKSVEDKLICEMIELNKPFVIVLNTSKPYDNSTLLIKEELENKYNVEVVVCDLKNMTEENIDTILQKALDEFPISKLDIKIPDYLDVLDDDNKYKKDFKNLLDNINNSYTKFKDIQKLREQILVLEYVKDAVITSSDGVVGEVIIEVTLDSMLFKYIVTDLLGEDIINSKKELLKFIQDSIKTNEVYKDYITPITECIEKGYGISIPNSNSMKLDTPEVTKNGNRYGIKLNAVASSIHMIKVDVQSSFEPIIGSFEQSKAIIDKLTKDFENNPNDIWNCELFGRKLNDVVNDGIKAKIYMMQEDTKYKMKETLDKIVNKGKGGVIAFVL